MADQIDGVRKYVSKTSGSTRSSNTSRTGNSVETTHPSHSGGTALSAPPKPSVLGRQNCVTTVPREHVVFHNLPGVATFFFKGEQLDLPPNFRTVWTTRALKG